MKKLLLTSAGFENPAVQDCFLEMLAKPPAEARALFIPTAAINDEARAVLPKCMGDLLGAGLPPGHITAFDLDREMPPEELAGYDAVYFCGGSAEYLLGRVKARGFDRALDLALERGLVYVGVSAGSIIAAQNLPGNLGYLPRRLSVHCPSGPPPGPLPPGEIRLTNAQAVKITGGEMEIAGKGDGDLEIVTMEPADPGILALFTEHDDFMLDSMGEDRKYYTRYGEEEKLRRVWAVCEEGRPVGCIAYREKAPGTGEVKRLFIREGYRGRGLSKRLLGALETYAREQGCHRLYLDTRLSLEAAVALYRAAGFQAAYRQGLYVQMEKEL